MRLLLDTHALLWSLLDDARLPRAVRSALAAPGQNIMISAVSIFEIALKFRLGKLNEAAAFVRDHQDILEQADWTPMPVWIRHASVAGSLDIPTKDPFDRLLIAQSLVEGVPLVSNEEVFDRFGVERIW